MIFSSRGDGVVLRSAQSPGVKARAQRFAWGSCDGWHGRPGPRSSARGYTAAGAPPLRRSTRGPAPQKMLIAVLGHPFRACQMALPGTARARRLARGIDVQDETGRLGTVRSVGLGIKEPEISDKVLLVVGGQSLGVWGCIGHRWTKLRVWQETAEIAAITIEPLQQADGRAMHIHRFATTSSWMCLTA